MNLSGRVVSGLGQGASFTGLSWAREQFLAKLGIEPYPGTLNLILDTKSERAKWRDWKNRNGVIISAPDAQWCDARGYPVRIGGRLAGAIIVPNVADYPSDQIEIISPDCVRGNLTLSDNDVVTLDLLPVDAIGE